MLQPLVIGLGRSGAGLHLRVLAQARDAANTLFVDRPVVACDPRPDASRDLRGVTITESLAEAAQLIDPESTVAHVCTPPDSRLRVLTELAELGLRNIIVEKPLAVDAHDLDRIVRLRARHGLNLVVVAHWLEAELTRRLRSIVHEGLLGPLRSISVAQHKPRFHRSLTTRGHPTVFDVEVPHSLGVVLRLAGAAHLVDAAWTPMRCGNTTIPRMGKARLSLRHEGGVRTEVLSDLTSPVQERRITLHFELGSATGHYPLTDNDDHAQLIIIADHRERYVFRDDALTAFVLRAYQRFQESTTNCNDEGFALQCDVVRLLCDAKNRCRATEPADHSAQQKVVVQYAD